MRTVYLELASRIGGEWFPLTGALQLSHPDGEGTRIEGPIRDDAEFYGLLGAVQACGVEIRALVYRVETRRRNER